MLCYIILYYSIAYSSISYIGILYYIIVSLAARRWRRAAGPLRATAAPGGRPARRGVVRPAWPRSRRGRCLVWSLGAAHLEGAVYAGGGRWGTGTLRALPPWLEPKWLLLLLLLLPLLTLTLPLPLPLPLPPPLPLPLSLLLLCLLQLRLPLLLTFAFQLPIITIR